MRSTNSPSGSPRACRSTTSIARAASAGTPPGAAASCSASSAAASSSSPLAMRTSASSSRARPASSSWARAARQYARHCRGSTRLAVRCRRCGPNSSMPRGHAAHLRFPKYPAPQQFPARDHRGRSGCLPSGHLSRVPRALRAACPRLGPGVPVRQRRPGGRSWRRRGRVRLRGGTFRCLRRRPGWSGRVRRGGRRGCRIRGRGVHASQHGSAALSAHTRSPEHCSIPMSDTGSPLCVGVHHRRAAGPAASSINDIDRLGSNRPQSGSAYCRRTVSTQPCGLRIRAEWALRTNSPGAVRSARRQAFQNGHRSVSGRVVAGAACQAVRRCSRTPKPLLSAHFKA